MSYTHDDAVLNTFAIRSFRDMADREYVLARLAYRARLIPQFLWCSLHSLEKYAKGILLLNRIPAKKLRHEVSGALALLKASGKFSIELSPLAAEFVARLETGAEFRYFEVSYGNRAHDVVRLDRAVSELRRYCQVLDWEIEGPNGTHNILEPMLDSISHAAEHNPRDTRIMSGWIENVLKSRSNPAREALVWNNLYFGTSRRRNVKLVGYEEGANSPLSMHPEILDDVLKYVYLPRRLVAEFRRELASGGPRDGSQERHDN